MKKELAILIDAFCQIAHEAGYLLLFCNDPDTIRPLIGHYNSLRACLLQLDPMMASGCAFLPDETSPGHVRIAARDTAAYAKENGTPCAINTIAA